MTKKIYDLYVTTYEWLKALPKARRFLKRGVSFRALNRISGAESDTEFARKMQTAKQELFRLCAQAGAGLPVPLHTSAGGQSAPTAPACPEELRRAAGGGGAGAGG